MSTVYHSSSTNSTTFTTCCKIAIGEEDKCPSCGEEVFPKGRNARFLAAHRNNLSPMESYKNA